MGDKVRLGIVGLGVGSWHVQTASAMDNVDLVAIADTQSGKKLGCDQLTLEEYCEREGAKPYTNGVEMIEQAELDAVDICVAPGFREDLLKAVATKGLPAMVEKPWAPNWELGTAWAKFFEGSDATVMPEFPLRHFPPLVELKKQLDDGPLGKPYMVCGDLQMAWIPGESHWAWDANGGNGLVNENTCHLIDTVCFLLGEPVSVYAEGRSFTGTGAPLEDAAAITVRFENGAIASLVGGGMSTNAIDTRTWLNVYTENGQGLVTGIAHMYDTLSWARRSDPDATTQTWENPPRLQIMRYSMRHFIDCVKSGATPSAGIDDAMKTLAICSAVHESFEKKAPVAISRG